MGRLAGKVAVVTGGSRGIGRAIVEKMLAEGARVTFLDVDREAGEAVAREVSGSSFLQADVTREAEVEAAMAEIVRREGALHVLVNNAGVTAYYDAAAMTEAQWDSVFAVDLKGAWLCVKHVLPAMKQGRSGSIVNISSIHARLTTPGMFPYGAAKAGLLGLTRGLALDCGPFGIRVNAILPGFTRTRLVEEWFSEQPDPAAARRGVLAAHPMGRIAEPSEIANIVAFVASDEAFAITGASIDADCGLGIRFAT